ncbi:MAG: hypothetical protein FJY77_01805 [Candidatus Altiarchaeales archaeon]|nr:hypothetical protein [Candidatus Altiarchaeales archaeon]
MKLLFDIGLRRFDESSLDEEDARRLLELFLESLGVTSDVARDLFEVLLVSRAGDTALTARQIRDSIIGLRKARKVEDAEKGLTARNIQIWLKYFKGIRLVDKLGDRYHFKGNKRPSRVFAEDTKPVVEESVKYVERVLKKVEEAYRIK